MAVGSALAECGTHLSEAIRRGDSLALPVLRVFEVGWWSGTAIIDVRRLNEAVAVWRPGEAAFVCDRVCRISPQLWGQDTLGSTHPCRWRTYLRTKLP